MSPRLIVVIVVLISLVGAGTYLYTQSNEGSGKLAEEETEVFPDTGRAMSIEQYVRENITDLSPLEEQLGGTFYVTEIEAHEGVGIVSYEDGHNAYTADFTYEIDPLHGAITMKTFVVR